MILLYCIFIRLPQTGVVGHYIEKIHLRNFINFYFIKGTNLTDGRSVFFVPFCDKKIDKNTSTCKNKKGDILNTELSRTLTIAEAKEQQELMEVISGEIPCQHLWKLMKVIAKN